MASRPQAGVLTQSVQSTLCGLILVCAFPAISPLPLSLLAEPFKQPPFPALLLLTTGGRTSPS